MEHIAAVINEDLVMFAKNLIVTSFFPRADVLLEFSKVTISLRLLGDKNR